MNFKKSATNMDRNSIGLETHVALEIMPITQATFNTVMFHIASIGQTVTYCTSDEHWSVSESVQH